MPVWCLMGFCQRYTTWHQLASHFCYLECPELKWSFEGEKLHNVFCWCWYCFVFVVLFVYLFLQDLQNQNLEMSKHFNHPEHHYLPSLSYSTCDWLTKFVLSSWVTNHSNSNKTFHYLFKGYYNFNSVSNWFNKWCRIYLNQSADSSYGYDYRQNGPLYQSKYEKQKIIIIFAGLPLQVCVTEREI